MEVAAAITLVIVLMAVLLGCWLLNVFGLPGNWVMLVVAIVYWYFVPADWLTYGWVVLVILGVLAILGEVVEFLAGAMGATKAGGSKRGAALAVIGSMIGGIVGIFVGSLVPIPIIGSLITALLFAGFGALLGAVLGEQWKGRSLDESVEIGKAAFWGRILGTLGKMLAGAVMLAVVCAAAVLNWIVVERSAINTFGSPSEPRQTTTRFAQPTASIARSPSTTLRGDLVPTTRG